MLDDGHLTLEKYLEEHKPDMCPDLYDAFKKRVRPIRKDLRMLKLSR